MHAQVNMCCVDIHRQKQKEKHRTMTLGVCVYVCVCVCVCIYACMNTYSCARLGFLTAFLE